ncbi:MAG: hypothetical protein NC177_09220 [Ruminococcus flavefaciens]|nr:hypothetical protein [Ruminococcus flavefaciens]
MAYSDMASFNAKRLRELKPGEELLDIDNEVYGVLGLQPKKTEVIVKDFQELLSDKGDEVTYELAEQITIKSLNNLAKKGKVVYFPEKLPEDSQEDFQPKKWAKK